MKPLQHAMISAHRYRGSTWSDWIAFHNWVDQSKAFFASMQHRMIIHSDFGAWLSVKILGETITAADGSQARTADLFTDHQTEDLGRTVPLSEWLRETRPDLAARRRNPPSYLEPIRDDAVEGLAERWGGTAADYLPLIAFFDMPVVMASDYPEAAMLITHSSFGIYLAEQLLGVTLTLSKTGKQDEERQRIISTRSAAEDLVCARLGWIPSASQLPSHTRLRLWMRGTQVRSALRTRLAREKGGEKVLELLDSCSAGRAESSC